MMAWPWWRGQAHAGLLARHHSPTRNTHPPNQVGYGAFAMRNLGARLMSVYFNPNPALFQDVFGFPISE
jgi:hypothetical protein